MAAGGLKPAQGGMVRVNVTAKEFSERSLLESLVRETLRAHTGGLADRERNAWAFDGLGRWWPERQPGAAAESAIAADWLTDARKVLPRDFSARHLDAWLSVGRDGEASRAQPLAASGLVVLAQRHGAAARRKFLAAMFRDARPADARGWFMDVILSRNNRLRAAAGIGEEQLVAEWREALASTGAP